MNRILASGATFRRPVSGSICSTGWRSRRSRRVSSCTRIVPSFGKVTLRGCCSPIRITKVPFLFRLLRSRKLSRQRPLRFFWESQPADPCPCQPWPVRRPPGRDRSLLRPPQILAPIRDAARLGVVTREVVDAADGWPAAEGGMGSVMVVPMGPGLQGTVAGGVGAVQPPIGPLLQQGPVEPLYLAVRLWSVGTSALVAHAGVGQRRREQPAAVADPVVGQHAGHGDAV